MQGKMSYEADNRLFGTILWAVVGLAIYGAAVLTCGKVSPAPRTAAFLPLPGGAAAREPAPAPLYVAHFDGCTPDMFGFPHIKGTAVNGTERDLSYAQITLRLLDASGAQVGCAIANTAGLQAHGKWRFEAMGACKGAVRYEMADVTAY